MAEPDELRGRAEPRPGAFEDSDGDSDDEDVGAYLVHDVVEQGAIERLRELLPPKPVAADGDDDDDGVAHPSMQVLAAETALLEKDDMSCLPLHVAIIYQRAECALHLLQYSDALTSAMLRMKCADLTTPPVHLILRVGGINATFANDMIRAIYGADENAIIARNEDLRALLFEALNAKDDEGNSVFHLCAMFNLSDAFDVLTKFYAKMFQLEVDDGAQAAVISSVPQLRVVLERGNRLGLRPLHVAIKFDSVGVARRLVDDYGVDVNSLTSLKQTPLHIAAAYGVTAGVSLLLGAQVPVDKEQVDSSGSTALQIAKRSGFAAVADLLSSEPVGDQPNESPRTCFFFHRDSLRHLPDAYHRRGGTEPPPENPERIDTLVDPLVGILRSREFQKDHITWDYEIEKADISDILRVHEYNYVRSIRQKCESLARRVGRRSPSTLDQDAARDDNEDGDDDPEEAMTTFTLDPDTALSLRSYEAAARAAGAVCRAVDKVVSGEFSNAFCIVRPPGHHAGPTGKVTCCNDPEGSHGFCVFNNVAIGAAYARSHFKHQGINRIAILDFDVHHGNGTEEIVRQLVPTTTELRYSTPYGEGKQIVHQYKPWRNEEDPDNVFFCSVHGYGHKDPQGDFSAEVQAAWFYPGSGESVVKEAPFIINVGMGFCPEGSSVSRLMWRSSFRDDVLPKLMTFQPDLIFLSAGFDAHKKENVNWGYVALLEQDYEWLVQHVKQVANACCQGRLISVLEGGYNFHGRMVSPFARSVAAHARALVCPSREAWDDDIIAKEAAHDRGILENYLNPGAAAREEGANGGKKRTSTSTSTSSATAYAKEPHATIAQSRSKRPRKQVDYVALAAELESQEASGAAAPADP